ncbi:MAG: J domain-containing protein [Proteobacteria bacterium]|nr:J domain-containing protein [Pseudomonadota bacterium]
MAKDFYEVLGVSKTATKEDIKKAYRKLARKWHPDINPGDKSAEQTFKEISGAYDCLGNEEKRKLYDEFGEDGLKSGFDAENARKYRDWGAGGQQGETAARDFGRYHSYEDIFGDLFGFQGQGTGFESPVSAKGRDMEYEMSVDLVSALKGFETEIALNLAKPCSACHGAGTDIHTQPVSCPSCKGSGRVNVAEGPLHFTKTCPQCGGRGATGKICPQCGGTGRSSQTERIKVNIPKGVKEGSRVRVSGKGEPGFNGGESGDLYLILRLKPHPFLERKGDDLTMDIPITVYEAMAGGAITVPTLEGQVKVKIPPKSQNGRVLKLKEKGADNTKTGKKGNLLIRLIIKVPETDDQEMLDLVKRTESLYKTDVRSGIQI